MTLTIEESLETFSREGNAFVSRHPEFNDAQATYGGLIWGFMRAIMECPNCPGHYRIPRDKEYKTLYSPCCGAYWDSAPKEPEEQKKKGAKKK
jgi:hypothetical protein